MFHTDRPVRAAGLSAAALPIALLGAALSLGGCASQPTEPATAEQTEQPSAAEQEARAAVQAAEGAVSQAQEASEGAVPEQATVDLLDRARDHLEADEFEAATEKANTAKSQANAQLAKWRKQQQMAKTEKAEPKTTMVANGRLTATPGADRGTYRVGRGDTLWDIAAADAIYGDPFAWPLIYKANSDRIKDADLIYPDQAFIIRWDTGGAAMDAAVRHAKTRGAWTLGEVEASDREYLQRN